jgi:hypothetical protein
MDMNKKMNYGGAVKKMMYGGRMTDKPIMMKDGGKWKWSKRTASPFLLLLLMALAR